MPLLDSYSAQQEQFTEERRRLLSALGVVTDGGIVESLKHIGATSVSQLSGEACIDIALFAP